MDIATYLTEISHAATLVLQGVWHEHTEVERSQAELARLAAATADGYERAAAWQESDDPDDYMLGVGLHYETYFGVDKKRHEANAAVERARAILEARTFSRAAMAATVLQYAKQGISLVHGKLEDSPGGREVGGVPIARLIWMARNQGLHWEDGSFNSAVSDCFDRLAAVQVEFRDYKDRNMAFETISLLGWRNFKAFEADLATLGGG